MKKIGYLLICAVFLNFWACRNMERDIDIELPSFERELVIESYLEAGQPYRVLLTESKSYFDPLDDCILVKGATVIIHHAGQSDTLVEASYFSDDCQFDNFFGVIPYFNADLTRFYNYGSNTICPLSYTDSFHIEVIDATGERRATASTLFLPPVEIDSTRAYFNDDDEAYAIFYLKDEVSEVNFYRVMLHDSSTYTQIDSIPFINFANDPEFDATLDDARFFNGENISFATDYDYEVGDTLIFTAYHIDQLYHDYAETLDDAQDSNGNPFAQPGAIVDNVDGGRGIFTFLSYDRDTLIVGE